MRVALVSADIHRLEARFSIRNLGSLFVATGPVGSRNTFHQSTEVLEKFRHSGVPWRNLLV